MIRSFSKLFFAFNIVLVGNALAQGRAPSLDNFSNAPTVTIGGFMDSGAGFRKQEDAYSNSRLPDAPLNSNRQYYTSDSDANTDGIGNSGADRWGTKNVNSNDVDFANSSEIHIKVAGINEYGLKYGAVVEIETSVNGYNRAGTGYNADKSYIFTESRSGKFEAGSNIGASQKMKVGPSIFARAAGGINGKYLQYINLPQLMDSTQLNNSSNQIESCDGYRVDSAGVVTEEGTCTNIKLPSFILVPTSPLSHGGYARSFYDTINNTAGVTSINSNGNYSPSADNGGFNKGKPNYLWRDGSFGDLEDANKISYYTPRIGGWQLGASFSPDSGVTGNTSAFTGSDSGDIKNVISWGLNYSNNFGNLGLALSATGERGDFEQLSYATTKRNDLNAYDVGAMLTYFGFTLGGSYGIWGDSLTPKSGIYSCQYDPTLSLADQDCDGSDTTYTNGTKKFDDSYYWSAGLAYEFGPVAMSVTHMNSEFLSNKYNATSVGIDYRLAKGLMPYLEFTQYKFESNQPKTLTYNPTSVTELQLKDNEGYVVLTGILLSF